MRVEHVTSGESTLFFDGAVVDRYLKKSEIECQEGSLGVLRGVNTKQMEKGGKRAASRRPCEVKEGFTE